MQTIDLIYLDAGGGHRAAARALQAVIRRQQRPWNVRLVHLARVLDPGRSFERLTGRDPEHLYNWRLQRGWTRGLGAELSVLQGLIRAGRPWLAARLRRHWASAATPDLVVSLVPNFNRVLREALADVAPRAPFVTVMTDLADLPPRFWIEADLDQHVVCGTDRAVEQARAAGHPEDRIHRTSGMVIDPAFYGPRTIDRAAELRALGLDPSRPTGLVMFGGQGANVMAKIARQLDGHPLILLCGHNRALAESLRAMRRTAAHAVLGFTEEVPRYMALCDWFVGKPGPGSLSEALQAGLPVITFRNAATMPQERYNTEWIVQQGVGRVVDRVTALPAAVGALLADLGTHRRRLAGIDNRAVFEIPELLERLLRERSERAANPAARPACAA